MSKVQKSRNQQKTVKGTEPYSSKSQGSELNTADALNCIMDFGCPLVDLPWPVTTYHVRFCSLLHPVISSVLFMSAPTRQTYYRKTTFHPFTQFSYGPLKLQGFNWKEMNRVLSDCATVCIKVGLIN